MAWWWFSVVILIGHIRVALSGLTFGTGYDFPCHCNSESCSQDNGFCSGGCQSGWFGPGCQIGNLALGQPAQQSSTMDKYFAANAVDGNVPEGDSALFCTHTNDSNAAAWWYVILNETRSYAIISVSIINRQGYLGRLSNFSILVSDFTDGNPHPSNWTLCVHWNGTAPYNRTYTCPALTFGRRLAVYLYGDVQSNPGHTLTLCEVGVYGYLYINCSSSIGMGPGCLLQSCNSSSCLAKNGSCGPLNSCEFPQCPTSTIPPDCWQTIPSLETAIVNTSSTCDNVSISLSNTALNGSNFGASYLALEVDNPTNSSSQLFNLSITNYAPVPITFPSEPNQSYILRVTPIVCTDGRCIAGTPSNHTSANVGRRFLSVSNYNNTCLSVQVSSSTTGCTLPTNYMVTCATQNNTTSSDSSTICGLHPEEAYNCSIQTVLYSGKFEHFDLKLNASDPNLAYASNYNGSCLSVSVNCTTAGCTLPIIYEVTCATQNDNMSSNGSTICGLHSDEAYNCSIQTVVYGGRVEHFYIKLNASAANRATAPRSENDNLVAAIVGGSVTTAVVVLVAISLIAAYLVRRRKASSGPTKSPPVIVVPIPLPKDAERQVEVKGYRNHAVSIGESDNLYENVTGMTLEHFDQYVKDEAFIVSKFKELPAEELHPCSVAKKPENKQSNRFQNMFPYDNNRVILHGPNSSEIYINASYVDGFARPRQYIATQGPSLRTVDDFWRMVWQEGAPVIVMLTEFVEQSKKKCEKYFPKPASEKCAIDVSVKSTVLFDTYCLTLVELKKADETKFVHHCHYVAWPDHSVPEHAAQVLLFRRRVNAIVGKNACSNGGPIVVHCSAGVGRTGAYLAIDTLLDLFDAKGRVDVDSCVMRLREQRMQSVQTSAQYMFIHHCLLHGMKTGQYIMSADELPAYSKSLGPAADESSVISKEWKILQDYAATLDSSDFEAGQMQENASKNRASSILPNENYRPYLRLRHGCTEDYINAVYCNGCFSSKSFVATQLPLPNTVNDFWRLVYDTEASCIVLLHDLPADKTCPKYWPEPGEEMATGSFKVYLRLEDNTSSAFTAQDFEIQPTSKIEMQDHNASVRLFHLQFWPSSADVPHNTELFLKFATVLQTWQKASPGRPVIIQCLDGASHSGLFIAAVNALFGLMEYNLVHALHTTELARTSQQQFVKNKMQYRFIYDLLLLHCTSTNVYANG